MMVSRRNDDMQQPQMPQETPGQAALRIATALVIILLGIALFIALIGAIIGGWSFIQHAGIWLVLAVLALGGVTWQGPRIHKHMVTTNQEQKLNDAQVRLLNAKAKRLEDTLPFDDQGNLFVRGYGYVPGQYREHPNLTNYHHAPRITGIREEQPQQPPPELEAPRYPEPRDFSRVLEEGFRPSRQSIYLLDTIDGQIAKDVYSLTHIGLGGPTGGGKTTTNRLIISQLLTDEVNAQVYLASPNFAPVKLNGNRIEDWRPIMCRLAEPPAQEAHEIRSLLKRFLLLFEKRKKQEWQSLKRGDDVFLVLGEWPGIVARVPEAVDIFKLLLRESRQYGIHVITEMQDALVKTIGVDSGCRDNLRTGYYYGGDATTAKVLLNLARGETIDETGLGQKGAVYLRTLTNKAVPGRVPFLSNAALYMLLGSPPDPMPDGVVYEGQIPERYSPVENGRYVEGSISIGRTLGEQGRVEMEPDEDTFEARPALSQKAFPLPPSQRNTGALEMPINQPLERWGDSPTTRPNYPTMTTEQVEQFKALYPLLGTEKALDRIEGCSHKHREHARVIIRQFNLQRRRA